MADTTNSSADPWGLPEDDPIPTQDAAQVDATADEAPTEPVEQPADQPEAAEAPTVDVAFEPIDDDLPELPPTPEPDQDPGPPPTQPESRGPLSQVLAASGLFGGSPVPAEDEPSPAEEPEEHVEPIEESIDVTALESLEEDDSTEPPDLTTPTTGASLGVGATDADLPLEPPPWMVAEPNPSGQDDVAEELVEETIDEVADGATEATLDEAAAAFAEVSFIGEAEEDSTFGTVPDLEVVEEASVPDAEFESLVAELADTALEVDDDTTLLDGDAEITIDPADTPSVFRELEDLSGSEPPAEIPAVDEAVFSFEDVTDTVEEVVEIESEDASIDDAERTNAEWGVFEFSEEPSEPDAPVFGVTFGKDDADDEEAELPDGGDEIEQAADEFGDETASPEDGQETYEIAEQAGDETALPDDGKEIYEIAAETEADLLEFGAETPSPDNGQEVYEIAEEAEGDVLEFGAETIGEPALESEPDEPDLLEPPPWAMAEPVAADEAAASFEAAEPAVTDEPSSESEEVDDAAAAAPETEYPQESAQSAPEEALAETISDPEPEEVPSIEWGSRWQESAQGWVEDDQGRSTWRPIVTTSPLLSEWQIDTYLGVVSADIVLGSGPIDAEMASARTVAMRTLVDEAMARGAHAIVGVASTMAPVGSATVLTATGTAVTLKAQD